MEKETKENEWQNKRRKERMTNEKEKTEELN